MDESTIIAHSCPPINYPEPQYIRGRQEDPVSKSVLNDEIKMSEITKVV